jgi:hypothetical protein
MQPFSPLAEQVDERTVGIKRLEKLDVRVASIEVREAYVRRVELLARMHCEAETSGVEPESLVGVADENGNVVQAAEMRHSARILASEDM